MHTVAVPVNEAVVLMSKYTGGFPREKPDGGAGPEAFVVRVVLPACVTLLNVMLTGDAPVVRSTGFTKMFVPVAVSKTWVASATAMFSFTPIMAEGRTPGVSVTVIISAMPIMADWRTFGTSVTVIVSLTTMRATLLIVPTPCVLAMVAPTGLLRLTKNVLSGSTVVLPLTTMLMVFNVSVGWKKSVPDCET